MYVMLAKNGCNCPVLVCDVCGGRLNKASQAGVVFNNGMTEGGTVRVYHVHLVNPAGGPTCQDMAEAQIRAQGGLPGWQMMAASLQQLVHNCGLSPKKLEVQGRLGVWGRM